MKNVEFKLNLCHHYDDDYGSQSVIIFFCCSYYEIENFFSYTDNRRQFPPIDWFDWWNRRKKNFFHLSLPQTPPTNILLIKWIVNSWINHIYNICFQCLKLFSPSTDSDQTRTQHLTIPLLFTIIWINYQNQNIGTNLEQKKRGKYWFEFWRKKNFFYLLFIHCFGQVCFFSGLWTKCIKN